MGLGRVLSSLALALQLVLQFSVQEVFRQTQPWWCHFWKAGDEHPEGHSHQDDVVLRMVSLRVKVTALGMNNTGPLSPLHFGMGKPQVTGKSLQMKGAPSREHAAVLCVHVDLQVLLQSNKYQTLICICFLMLTLQQCFSSICQSLPEDKSIGMLNPTLLFLTHFRELVPVLPTVFPQKRSAFQLQSLQFMLSECFAKD